MASLTEVKDGKRQGWKIQFYGPDRKKRVLWLGDMTKSGAQQWKLNVEHLISARAGRSQPIPRVAAWLAEQEAHLVKRLANAGLIEQSAVASDGPETIGELLKEYQEVRASLSPRSKVNLGQAAKSLNRYFGEGRRLAAFTLADGLRYREWALEDGKKPRKEKKDQKPREDDGLAEATVRKFCQVGRQVFSYAAKRKAFTGSNPFSDVPTSAVGNPERSHYVSREVVQRIIDRAPDAYWRAIIALSRFGGLRIPSELTTLRWADVDLAARRMVIQAPKTGTRVCPLFPELVEHFEDLASLAKPGIDAPLSSLVIPFVNEPEKNLRTELSRIIKRAGVKQWPRIWHNMRATRQTELMAQGFPERDVCAWIGNSRQVAMAHYLMETSDAFDRATGLSSGGCSTGCSTPNPTESPQVSIDHEKHREKRLGRSREDSRGVDQYPLEDSNL